MNEGARQSRCAAVLGLSERTLQRWRGNHGDDADGRSRAVRPVPGNALSAEERTEVLRQCNLPENASKPPAQIVVELADRGIYLASESTFYRVLRCDGQQHHRGKARAPRPSSRKPTHTAHAPNQVWCWDITWLPSQVAGLFFKLYLILDLFSRKIVAYEVWAEENAEHSQTLLRRAALSEKLASMNTLIVLHGDNGSPLKAGTVQATMRTLGFCPSHSRPRVSNDNAHAEALFRTAKYHPTLPPEGFADLESARQWACSFVHTYNYYHRHSALRFVTPAEKHSGEDRAILRRRKKLYENARKHRPDRWFRKTTRNWNPVTFTSLNPIDPKTLEKTLKKSA